MLAETIQVVRYDLAWAASFDREAARILNAVGEVAIALHHIGSTAIAQTCAKPVVDMLLEVTSLAELDAKASLIAALGYEWKGEYGIPGRRYFRLDDGAGNRTHQLHAYQAGVPDVIRHIAFRDYMRAHPLAALAYGQLKARLASDHPHDMAAYVDGKNAFVKQHEALALRWLEVRE